MSDNPETPLDATQLAAQEQFSRQSHRYGKGHILEDTSDIRAALEGIVLPEKARVLDVATGGGHTALFFADQGHEVTACDISGAMLVRVQAAATERGLTIETKQHPAEALPYDDGTFDLVTCRVAPHHFSSPGRFVREASRILKVGGKLLVIDGTVQDGEPDAELWMHRVEKFRDPSHNRFITPAAWKRLCGAAGLEVNRSELHPMKQPDLEWYFDTADTSPENRLQVLDLIMRAPESALRLFQINIEEDERIVWWWQRLTLVATKKDLPPPPAPEPVASAEPGVVSAAPAEPASAATPVTPEAPIPTIAPTEEPLAANPF